MVACLATSSVVHAQAPEPTGLPGPASSADELGAGRTPACGRTERRANGPESTGLAGGVRG